ncbi:MAG: YcgL domain-containing protein [Halieaceae bacterium]
MSLLCEVFRSPRKTETYLYIDKQAGLAKVPESLLAQFGEPESVMTLLLTADRKLARASAAEVLTSIEEKGFFLQMPPTPAELLSRERARE